MNCQEVLFGSKKRTNPYLREGRKMFSLILRFAWLKANYSLNKNKPLSGGKIKFFY